MLSVVNLGPAVTSDLQTIYSSLNPDFELEGCQSGDRRPRKKLYWMFSKCRVCEQNWSFPNPNTDQSLST